MFRVAASGPRKAMLVVGIAIFAALATGCDRSCGKLADQLCERAELYNEKNADELCERWRERTKRVGNETCQAALRTLDRDRVAP